MDPPWNEHGGGKIKRGADKHYTLMTNKEIYEYAEIEIKPLIAENAHAYIWVTNNYLEAGLELLKKLGFKYITNIVWIKDKIGLGQYFRGQHEICLFGVKGKTQLPTNHQQTTIIIEKRTKHSKKPHGMYTKIEAVSPPPRIEIFSRHTREGWETTGKEKSQETQKVLREEY